MCCFETNLVFMSNLLIYPFIMRWAAEKWNSHFIVTIVWVCVFSLERSQYANESSVVCQPASFGNKNLAWFQWCWYYSCRSRSIRVLHFNNVKLIEIRNSNWLPNATKKCLKLLAISTVPNCENFFPVESKKRIKLMHFSLLLRK